MAVQCLVNSGEPVLVEEPCYQGVEGALLACGAQRVTVNADTRGFQTSRAFKQAVHARLAMVTPSRNFPVGYTMSLERRLSLIQWARETGSWIIEDDYDSEFRFDGPPITSLQGLGGKDCVLYTGTFSRIFHPSIRLGYMVLPEFLTKPFHHFKAYMDEGFLYFRNWPWRTL